MRIRSLTTQTTLIVALGLTVAYLAGLFLYSRDRLDALIHLSLQNAAQTISHLTHTVAASNPGWRVDIVKSFDEPYIRASLTGRPTYEEEHYREPYESAFRQFLESESHAGEMANIRISLSEQAPLEIAGSHRDSFSELFLHILRTVYRLPVHLTVRVSIKLDDGRWFNLAHLTPEFPAELWSPSLLTVGIMTLAIVLIAGWVVRRMLRPLDEFARASRRFAADIHAPPMPSDGPSEVQEVANAFNDMQDQVRNLIRSRTEMLGAISHDLRTPLSLLKLRTENLPPSDDRDKLSATVSQMDEIISSTLALAKQAFDQEERRQVDICSLLQAICDDLAETGNSIVLANADEQLLVNGQALALRRAFTNLFDNGLRYGSQVMVFVGREGSAVTVRIEDNGPGISENEMLRVFEPFYRCDQARSGSAEGTGLGLSLVRTIIQNHGGTIELKNREPKGLSAVVILPC